MRDALATALAHTNGPVVVDMVVDPNALAVPSDTPVKTMKNFTLSLGKQAVHGNLDDVIHTAEDNVRLM